ncbi:hypothetical protein U9M48_036147 [Paspalum notatum var. saurae]|uniref:Uncharacterized protein n=1 Tax=Paspalum notatum var. saurae TaxID=547442 RepID=A0AAQ3X9Q9_PASNO
MIGSLLYLTATRPDIQSRSAFVRVTRIFLGLLTVKRRSAFSGVDNALIKGEIESQWTSLIALLV